MRSKQYSGRVLLAVAVSGSILGSWGLAQAEAGKQGPTAPPAKTATTSKRHSYRPTELPPSAQMLYQSRWGVDMLSVKSVDSGMLIRFNYRVLDADKAQALHDKKSTPYLIDNQARVKLVVPTLEKVGELRDKETPEPGKVYWMVFSNKGHFVRPGHRVSVEIGKFRVDGLVVQ